MSKTHGNAPAFPVSLPGWTNSKANGLSLREYFAGQALAGLACKHGVECGRELPAAVEGSVKLADAMIVALREGGE